MGMINCKWDKILALGPLLFQFEWWSRNSRVFPTVKQDKDPSDLQRYFPFSQNMSNSTMLQKLQVWVYPNDQNQHCRLGCIEFFFYLIFIRLTLFSLYFLILRTIYFLTFFDLRPPSFANFNFCLLMGIRRNFNGKIIRFLIPCRNMVYIWSIWF